MTLVISHPLYRHNINKYYGGIFIFTVATCIFSLHLYNAQHCSLEVTKRGIQGLSLSYSVHPKEHCNLTTLMSENRVKIHFHMIERMRVV
jgi:hypothetical protein